MGFRGKTGRWVRRIAIAFAIGFAFITAASLYVGAAYSERMVAMESAPEAPVVVVFGAGLGATGVPSRLLADRLDTAIALYRAGKAKKLLLSGDNSDRYHDEVGAMRRYVEGKGIPPADLLFDAAGLSTYQSCFRAREVFGLNRALLVTQRFHLGRALFLANSFGIDGHGVPAGDGRAVGLRLRAREFFSRALALGMTWFLPKPQPPANA
jgi:vancomycin permeability regulator SanA